MSFYGNGEAGSISIKTRPGARDEISKIGNGTRLFISHTYSLNGNIWGLMEINSSGFPTGNSPSGWVQMEQLLLIYDYISFAEDYGDKFYDYTETLGWFNSAVDVVMWTWPGSGYYTSVVESRYLSNTGTTVEYAYKDSDGREWGFTKSKYYGNVWVCLSDLSNNSIPAFNPAPEPARWQPGEEHLALEPSGGLSLPVLIIILVISLAAVTAVLIRVFWKKDKHS